jgi:cytochrome c oxidase assembly protein subunit 11
MSACGLRRHRRGAMHACGGSLLSVLVGDASCRMRAAAVSVGEGYRAQHVRYLRAGAACHTSTFARCVPPPRRLLAAAGRRCLLNSRHTYSTRVHGSCAAVRHHRAAAAAASWLGGVQLRGLASGVGRRSNAEIVRDRTAERTKMIGIWCAGLVVGMVGLSYAFVPLYRMFCQATGYGGTANESTRGGGEVLSGMTAVSQSRLLTIEFTSDVSPNLSWIFEPAQRFVRVQPGETSLAFYNATNSHEEPVTGISTYNVSPQKAGLYFHKIQCFCFEEQRLLVRGVYPSAQPRASHR